MAKVQGETLFWSLSTQQGVYRQSMLAYMSNSFRSFLKQNTDQWRVVIRVLTILFSIVTFTYISCSALLEIQPVSLLGWSSIWPSLTHIYRQKKRNLLMILWKYFFNILGFFCFVFVFVFGLGFFFAWYAQKCRHSSKHFRRWIWQLYNSILMNKIASIICKNSLSHFKLKILNMVQIQSDSEHS